MFSLNIFVFLTLLLIGIHEINGFDEVADHTSFCVYTRTTGNKCAKLKTNDSSTITNSAFNVSKPIKIIVPGWMDFAYGYKRDLRKAYLAAEDVNVIGFDWLYYYFESRKVVEPVGKHVAEFIDWLVTDIGASLDSIHLIGFSIGAQLVGVIGEQVTVGKVGRITSLEPTGLYFNSSTTTGRLDASDAQFVDVIHTTNGILGFDYYEPCGHADFYPNGGIWNQPGTTKLDLGVFSHIRSYKLFIESITSSNFVAQECDSWDSYKEGLCVNGTYAVMGEKIDNSARGKFYLRTASSSPFALG